MKSVYFSVIKFPIFVSLSLILLITLFFGIAVHDYYRLGLSPTNVVVYTIVYVLLTILVFTWIMILTATHSRIRPTFLLHYFKAMLVYVYYYLGKGLAMICGQNKQSIYESFLHLNNEIIYTNYEGLQKEEILLLLPHCLQSSSCEIRIVDDIQKCEECGSCDIAGIKSKLLPKGTKVSIVTGGTIARETISRARPKLIIAVACHRELMDGVRDCLRYPVYALLNERPQGACKDTVVSIKAIEFAITKFTS